MRRDLPANIVVRGDCSPMVCYTTFSSAVDTFPAPRSHAHGACQGPVCPVSKWDPVAIEDMTGTSKRHHDNTTSRRCGSKTRLPAVLVLAAVAGCTTIALQLVASHSSGPKQSLAVRAGFAAVAESSLASARQPMAHQQEADGVGENPYGDLDRNAVAQAQPFRRLPLVVDRRFSGQRTGQPRRPEEEVPHRPPASPDGPFGWGTDWIASVGVPDPYVGIAEDVIERAPCQASWGNQSFVDSVIERRIERQGEAGAGRVVSCTRTKDRGRYLPEWAAYHWAIGVDEMYIFDDASVDDTREVLEPFVRAGIVKFQPHRIHRDAATKPEHEPATAAAPLQRCLKQYQDMHDSGDPLAPRWVVLVDADDYLWAAAVPSETLQEVLGARSATCCLQVSTVRHGTSGLSKSPRGLLLENFLTHGDPTSTELNGPPKVIVNFQPGKRAVAASAVSGEDENQSLPSVLGGVFGEEDGEDGGEGKGCRCEAAAVSELAVRRYPLTREDLMSKEMLYSALRQRQREQHQPQERQQQQQQKQQQQQQQQPVEEVQFDEALDAEALNNHRSEEMLQWGCVVRHLLSRVADGKNMVTGQPQRSLSPHHPISHGARGMDPFGEEELRRTEACISAVRSSPPAAAGSTWGRLGSLPPWVQRLCSSRYVFVHSFKDTGEKEVVRSLASHPWVRSHGEQAAVNGGGCALTSAIPAASERETMPETALSELCGCADGASFTGCQRYCPKLQGSLLAARGINKARQQLVLDWLLRFNLAAENSPVVLVERDPDMLVASKQGLFPFVSTSLLTVRHPLCTPTAPRAYTSGKGFFSASGGCKEGATCNTAADLRDWREVWTQVLTTQVSQAAGASVWVVRFEDLILQQEEVTSALWATVGLPPISPYPVSRATPAVRNTEMPWECRQRAAACEESPVCELELLRSARLLDFFGYGGVGLMLNSQRYLWGKEELEWLGKRLAVEPNDPPHVADVDKPNERGRGGGADSGFDADDEPSVILPQFLL